MKNENTLKLGQVVYLETDPDQLPRRITRVQYSIDGGCTYCLSNSTNDTWHYAEEITEERNILTTLK